MHKGRWFYECHIVTGDLQKYDSISIVWNEQEEWWQVHAGSAKGYIDMPLITSNVGDHDYDGYLDHQYSESDTVCVDPDAMAYDFEPDSTHYNWLDYENHGDYPNGLIYGSLECLGDLDWVF